MAMALYGTGEGARGTLHTFSARLQASTRSTTATATVTWLVLLAAVPTALGWTYAVYNIDAHHWGFIAATALDVIQGKRLFTETYVQYGVGQPLLFWLLNPIAPVNYTMTGLVTSAVYALTLVLIFLAVRRITNGVYAFAASGAALLVHSYAIYPWPDYYAGMFLECAAFVLLGKHSRASVAAIAGGCLFLSFLFRNTYLITLGATTLAYGAATLFRVNLRDRMVTITLLTAWGLLAAYLSVLWLQGVPALWFAQTLGAGASFYGVSIPDGAWRLVRNVLFPIDLGAHAPAALTFSVLVCSGSLFVVRAVWHNTREGMLVFLALLGLAGLSQVAVSYEVFRLQNACVVLYPVCGALVFSQRHRLQTGPRSLVLCLFTGLYLALLLVQFPYASSLHPLIETPNGVYVNSDIPFFSGHRFKRADAERYEQLTRLLCDGRSRIVNMTADSTIPYLCPGQQNAAGLPFFIDGLTLPADAKHLEEIQNGIVRRGELVVTEILPPRGVAAPWAELGQVRRPGQRREDALLHILAAAAP